MQIGDLSRESSGDIIKALVRPVKYETIESTLIFIYYKSNESIISCDSGSALGSLSESLAGIIGTIVGAIRYSRIVRAGDNNTIGTSKEQTMGKQPT